ncbi:MAG: response regulator transcription factor [Phycisphaerae bacterium]|nr:response regulator transcription factor [Phycisphaerae bacterium]
MRILVVEDNQDLAGQIAATLEQRHYVVEQAHDGEEGRFLGETESYDAVVLDLGLPKLDGLSVLQHWRSHGIGTPVLILTCRDTWREKVTGLRAGADDYLAKPFEFEELLARLEALIHRATGYAQPRMRSRDGRVDLDTTEAHVWLDGRPIELTALEYRTLEYLMHQAGKVTSKTELSDHIYGHDFDNDSNVIEVLVNRLRHKLYPELITTRRGLGYQVATR